MILGTGIDLVEISRIESSLGRHGERFLHRILLPGEVAYCLSYAKPGPHVAARFAAKEAVSKAFGTGIGARLGWHDIEVIRQSSGEPIVMLHAGGERLLVERGARRIHLSLTHTNGFAAAVAILEA
ncbi:MAG TPA: holo-ACP synthase [Verrucomicrobiota bacterium]|nr:holo-[acyl-carrier-protein] synthase [Verrucomicrobiales bacterium]HRI16126.1 holo-ACP synthase [Verrucomicrobiota bacterium]